MLVALFIVSLLVSSFCGCSLDSNLQELELKVGKLDDEIQSFNSRRSKITRYLNIKKDRSSRDQFIAFFSTLRDDVTPISIKEVIVFDKVITNYGNAYDPYIGRFRSNVPGYYHFVTNVMSSMGHFLDVDLVRDNNVICKARATYNGMGTCAVTTYVHTNSSVWIRHAGSKGDFIKGDSFSSFTGFLLKPI